MGSKPQALAAPAQPSAPPRQGGAGPHGAPPRRHGTKPGSKPQALAAPAQPSAPPRQGALDRTEHHRSTTARASAQPLLGDERLFAIPAPLSPPPSPDCLASRLRPKFQPDPHLLHTLPLKSHTAALPGKMLKSPRLPR